MKLSGDRLRIAKITPNGDLTWNLPASGIKSVDHLKHVIQYDDRPGKVYHVNSKLFRNWSEAVKYAINGTLDN